MADDREAFLKKLLTMFRVEASDHLEAMGTGLVSLETASAERKPQLLEHIYREAHSLKGAARAVGLNDAERLCHSLESLFAAWKANRVVTNAALFDLVHEAIDLMTHLVSADETSAPDPRLRTLMETLDRRAKGQPTPRAVTPPVEASGEPRLPAPRTEAAMVSLSSTAGTIRIEKTKLDSIMRQTEELLGPRLAAAQRVADLRETRSALALWQKEQSALKSSGRPLETKTHSLRSLDSRLAKLEKTALADHRTLAGIVDGLLSDVKELHMLPFSSVSDGLRKVARDLARDHGKEVELDIRGGEIAVDRRVLDEIRAPLNHILRNSIDHGIEAPAGRHEKGKPNQGRITMTVRHRGNRIEISVGDDGSGVNLARVEAAARKAGITPAVDVEHWSGKDKLSLIFQSGVSTSPLVTEVSGRGLGLAIVREHVERLGGRIDIETFPDVGTEIRLDLPLTLATFRGVLVAVGSRRFMIPAAGVERVARVASAEILTVENRETIAREGRAMSLVWLADVLELPRSGRGEAGFVQIVVLGTGLDRIAFAVDEVLAEQEVLVKGLGPQLANLRNVSGASVLGTGEIVPVLSIPELMASAVQLPPGQLAAASEVAEVKSSKIVLVVEDSITSRMLLKGILESAGYEVLVAVDGVDALTLLKTTPVDAIVSDVEMPRMDGFELTRNVKAERSLLQIPVVLVTALGSREDRERGIEAGANAYIIKSSFDQSNLLEVLRRLI